MDLRNVDIGQFLVSASQVYFINFRTNVPKNEKGSGIEGCIVLLSYTISPFMISYECQEFGMALDMTIELRDSRLNAATH